MAVAFFFQAEDSIRDVAVTGVQTCALPISKPSHVHGQEAIAWTSARASPAWRSEERRVGEECSARGRPRQSKEARRNVLSREYSRRRLFRGYRARRAAASHRQYRLSGG